jgi:hypothetical protein
VVRYPYELSSCEAFIFKNIVFVPTYIIIFVPEPLFFEYVNIDSSRSFEVLDIIFSRYMS